MHYYQFNIGDYRKDTIHLSRIEHGIYRDLIDWYYLDEKPIPKETQVVSRRLRLVSEEEVVALKNVLSDFFSEQEDGFHHDRIDQDIAEYHAQCVKNQANGRKGGRPKGSTKAKKTQSVSTGLSSGYQSQPTGNPNQEPITTNQLDIEPNGSVDKVDRLPRCNFQSIVDLYHKNLPEMPRVIVVNDQRKRLTSEFWRWVFTSRRSDGTKRAENTEQALEWINAYFKRARDNDFLMGRTQPSDGRHAKWKCDFDFLLSDRGKKHVIEKTESQE